jgi:hypothetical protein
MGAPIIFVPKPNVMEIQRYFGNAKHFTWQESIISRDHRTTRDPIP